MPYLTLEDNEVAPSKEVYEGHKISNRTWEAEQMWYRSTTSLFVAGDMMRMNQEMASTSPNQLKTAFAGLVFICDCSYVLMPNAYPLFFPCVCKVGLGSLTETTVRSFEGVGILQAL